MLEKKIDRRIKKTKDQLRKCLTQLMEHKPLKEITVKELTDYADINRGTFYLHYNNLHGLLSEYEDDLIVQFETVLNRYPDKDMSQKPYLIFMDLFNFIYENADLCRILLSERNDTKLVEKLVRVVQKNALNQWITAHTISEDIYEYYCSYIVHGCIGLINQWTKEGMTIPPKEMSIRVTDIILNGIKGL